MKLLPKKEDADEMEGEDDDQNLKELLADAEELDGDESAAFKKHISDLLEQDKDLVKNIIKGQFKRSIMIKTTLDAKRERDERVGARSNVIGAKTPCSEEKIGGMPSIFYSSRD